MNLTTGTFNPYFDEFMQFVGPNFDYTKWDAWYHDDLIVKDPDREDFTKSRQFQSFQKRDQMIHAYSWAVPGPEAIDAIASRGPIIEIGAGTGYWAGAEHRDPSVAWN